MPLKKRMAKEDAVHLHNGVLCSCFQNKNIMKFASKWMQLEKLILCEVTQIQKDKYSMYSLKCEYSLLTTLETSYK